MLFSTLSLSNRGSQTRIIEAKSLLFEQISKLKQYNRMNELKELLKDLTQSDRKQLEAYSAEIVEAKKDLEYHQKKIKYYEALIGQREGFVDQIEAKLKRIEKLEGKLSNTLQ